MNGNKFQNRSMEPVVIKSRMKAWWLVVMRGYNVDTIRRRPRLSRLGTIEYDVEWHLFAPESSNED